MTSNADAGTGTDRCHTFASGALKSPMLTGHTPLCCFTAASRLLHYHLPVPDVLFLHSGCNMGRSGDVTIFLGLSGGRSHFLGRISCHTSCHTFPTPGPCEQEPVVLSSCTLSCSIQRGGEVEGEIWEEGEGRGVLFHFPSYAWVPLATMTHGAAVRVTLWRSAVEQALLMYCQLGKSIVSVLLGTPVTHHC